MFTGIIEEIGTVLKIDSMQDGRRLKISASKILDDAKVDDSIAVNGVCLTVVKVEHDCFWAEAVGATIKKTTLNKINQNTNVNLERAVRLSDRLGGHLVQGHVNGIGTIKKINRLGENYFIEINILPELEKYVIKEGSIAVDGISLTVAELSGNYVGLSVIPHTWKNTNLCFRKISDEVNIEVDVIAKYVEKLLGKKSVDANKLTDDVMKNLGY